MSRQEQKLRRHLLRKIERRMLEDVYADANHAADDLNRLTVECIGRKARPNKSYWRHITMTLSAAAKSARKLLRRLPLLLLFAGCAAQPGGFKPLVARRPIVAPAGTNYTAPAFIADIPWRYASDPTFYCWVLQSSSNLTDWIDLPGACVTDPLIARATNGLQFFRLKGSP